MAQKLLNLLSVSDTALQNKDDACYIGLSIKNLTYTIMFTNHNHNIMQKTLLTMGLSLLTGLTTLATGPQNISSLLGLKNATGGGAMALTGAPVRAKSLSPSQERIKGIDNPDGSKVYILGCVVSPDHITGMWSYTTDAWDPNRLESGIYATGGGFGTDSYYYANSYREAMGYEEIKTSNYDLNTWEEYDSYTGKIQYVATTMAYSPARDQVYGCFINESRTGYVFVEWRYDYFQVQRTICPLEKPWAGCAFSSDNTLYAIDRDGDLWTVALTDGKMTKVGSTGISTQYLADATIDTNTDTMYWCVNTDTENALYTVDIKTAKATKLYDMENEEQLCGMYVPSFKTYASDVPEAISSVSLSFSGTSLSGKVSFSMPSRLNDKSTSIPAGTEMTYIIRANGKEIARGTSTRGTRVNADVTLPTTDSYNFTVVTVNEAGESPAAKSKKFIGPDTPKAPTNFRMTLDGNNVKLTWSSTASSGVSGGSVAYTKATYDVTRMPDGKKVAEGISERTVTDVIPEVSEQTEFYYILTATCEGLTSPEAKSESIKAGSILPPATINFEGAASLFGWTILEGEKADDAKWAYYDYEKALRYYSSIKTGADDWAISPAVVVKGGAAYPISVDFKTSNYYDEEFEVMWGTEPTVAAMTNVAIPAATQKNTEYTTYTGTINTLTDGKIYIGIHCKSAGQSQLYARNIVIGEGVVTKAPAQATLNVIPATDGSVKADINYTIPATSIDGNALTGATALTSVEIKRDGNVIKTITSDFPAGEQSFEDNATSGLTLGKHTYEIVATNAYGAGHAATVEVTVGPGVPAAPADVVMLEEGNTGKVKVTWKPVTTDVDGNTIKSEAVTYKVIDRNYKVLADNLTATSFEIQAVPEGEQAFVQFGVYAVTVGGESKLAGSAYKPVGAPYATPWKESFAGGAVSSIFGYNYLVGQEGWQFGTDPDWSASPQDADQGLAYFEAYGGVSTGLVTGKIDLSGVPNPAFTYYTYRYSDNQYSNQIALEVDNGDGRGFVRVSTDDIFVGENASWHKVTVGLEDYDGQAVVFRIVPTCSDPKNLGAFFFIDNLNITSHADYNLALSAISAPDAVNTDTPFEISVTVTNTGDNEVRGYNVELWSGDEFITSRKASSSLAPEATANYVFETTATSLHGESKRYHAVVVSDIDEIEADNKSNEVEVGVVAPAVPVPQNLSGSYKADGLTLTWSEPDMASAPSAPFTEDFENADSWAQAVDGWKILDEDDAPLISIRNPNFPFGAGKKAGWWVTPADWGETDTSKELWKSHSGNKFLTSGSVQRGNTPEQCDDWAISPRLDGCEQMVSLYARSFYGEGNYAGYYMEDFDVLYSKNTTTLEDFQLAGSVTRAPFSWTKYQFRLPEGSLYFAIRSRSTDQFFLFIDDVTYIAAGGAPATLTLKGYNVYRDGEKLNTEVVSEETYIDKNIKPGADHKYVVTAVYANGESRPGNEYDLLLSGVDNAFADGLAVEAGNGCIRVKNAGGVAVEVFTPQGMRIANVKGEANTRIDVQNGIYIVRAGRTTAKVYVK